MSDEFVYTQLAVACAVGGFFMLRWLRGRWPERNPFSLPLVATAMLCLFTLVVCGRAEAQSLTICPQSPRSCDQGAAYQAARDVANFTASCRESPFGNVSAYPSIRAVITGTTMDAVGARYQTNFNCQWLRSTDQTWQTHAQGKTMYAYWVVGQTCGTRPNQPTWDIPPGHDGAVCSSGCEYALDVPGPGLSPTGEVCDTNIDPVVDTDNDGVPDEDDAFPNDPNESVDSDGDGIGDNADVAPNDPANGEDEAGEEDGDDEGDNSAQGGGDCKGPPVCKGDGIACNTNFQVWKARCAAEANGGVITGSPGTCGAAYTCTGPAVQCAQLAVQRQALCADAGEGDGDGTVAGGSLCSQPYVCTGGDAIACAQLREAHRMRCLTVGDGDGDSDDMGPELDPGEYFGVGQGSESPISLDASGWLGGGSCPAIVEETFEAQGSASAFCSGGSVLGFYVMFMAYLTAARIIGRAVTGGGA